MLVLGIDLETTGLDTANDRITELGYVLWEIDTSTPVGIVNSLIYEESMEPRFTPEAVEMMERVCGITVPMLHTFGIHPDQAIDQLLAVVQLYKPEYVIGHNWENFDGPMLAMELKRQGGVLNLPSIDTRTDLPFATEPDSRKLKHLALDCGFINPFPHRAVTDVLTMLKVLSHYPIEQVIEYSKIPWITVRADVKYEQRELAKARRYSWEKLGEKTYSKCWVKRIKENTLEQEKKEAPFPVLVLS